MSYPRHPPQGSNSGKGFPEKQPGPPPQHYNQAPPGYQQVPPQYPPQYGQNAPPAYTPYPSQQQNPYPQQQPITYMPVQQMAASAYDAGARFDGNSRPNVPPPPPGVAPNAAQIAASQGQPVFMQQRQANWLEGGSGAGYTFW